MANISVREAINDALHTAMRSSKDIYMMGEDIAHYGGQLRCTYGLVEEFGEERVRDAPISEAAILGAGTGSSLVGKRPIIEIPYIDFIGICFDQIMNQAAKLRYMYGGHVEVPLVIRTQCGAGLGNAAQHSQSLESILAHIPGLRVVIPSTPYDAKGLLLHAIQDNNPVFFIEHKALYNKKGEVPEDPYEIEYSSDIKRKGNDISIITYSSMVWQALEAAKQLDEEGISVEVVDLRVLEPLDMNTVIESVKKTNHALVLHEAVKKGGFGGEIVSQLVEEAYENIKAPIKRVAAPDVPVPYSKKLEDAFLPSVEEIKEAVYQTINFSK